MTGSKGVGILGLPFDGNSSFLQGPRFAPGYIREALRSDHWNMTTELGVDLDAAGWTDYGDLKLADLGRDAVFKEIQGSVGALLDSGATILSLGGDHSVSYPAIKPHAERYPGLSVLHIDAHPDLYDLMMDNYFSHASPFARLMEQGLVKRLVQAGIRTLNAHQKQQAERFGVEIIAMRDWSPRIRLAFEGPLYLSLDVDALDPAYAPGVSHLEPGGLSSRDVIGLIQNVEGQLIGADVVEFNPLRDMGMLTASVSAKMVKEILGRLFSDRPARA